MYCIASISPEQWKMSIPLLSSPNLPCEKSRSISVFRATSKSKVYSSLHSIEFLKFRCSESRIEASRSCFSSCFSLSSRGRLGFCAVAAGNGRGGEEKSVAEDAEEGQGESTMPLRFRYLTEEAPDRPLRWPWLIALAFLIYTWRAVLWELSNWKKAVLVIASFIGYLSKLLLAFVFHFIGDPITNLIRFIETVLYSIRSMYSSIVASAPVSELTVIIMLTSSVLAIAETVSPDSVNSQPYLLTFAGLIGFAVATDYITELFFWVLLVGMFCFSKFVKKRDYVQSALPVAAVLAAVGNPWVRFIVMGSYLALAISHYSKCSQENLENKTAARSIGVPIPLVGAALAIGIHVAAKWIRYRHLTWMIV